MPSPFGRGLRVVIAGGGTLGHVLPGLAVAEAIVRLAPDARVAFTGHCADLEAPHVNAAGFVHRAFRARALPQRWREYWPFVRENVAGYLEARRWLKHFRPHVVLATGGYACAATARACLSERLPLVLLELNALPGRTSRWLARRAAAVCVASPAAAAILQNPNWWLTGTPLRPGFFRQRGNLHAATAQPPRPTSHAPPVRDGSQPTAAQTQQTLVDQPALPVPPDTPRAAIPNSQPIAAYPAGYESLPSSTLVVLGGSRGAEELNQCVPQAIALAARHLPASATHVQQAEPSHIAPAKLPWQVIHVAGRGRSEATAARYARWSIDAQVLDHLDAPADLLSRADVAICRCGASTLAELAASGVPAVLVPYRAARDDHQMANALEVARAGGGLLVDAPRPEAIAHSLIQLADEQRRHSMAQAMRRLATPEAAHRIATLVLRLASRQVGT